VYSIFANTCFCIIIIIIIIENNRINFVNKNVLRSFFEMCIPLAIEAELMIITVVNALTLVI